MLVVDFDRDVRESLCESLRGAGYEAIASGAGEEAMASIAERLPDAVLIERRLPDIDGRELCRRLRRLERRMPVLMFAAEATVGERIGCLEAGADYCLPKPLSLPEVTARVRALLRRVDLERTPPPPPPPLAAPPPLRFAELRLDPAAYALDAGGPELALTRREYELLELFMQNPERVLEHGEIFARVWGRQSRDTAPLRVYVGYLRGRMREAGARQLIQTVPGRGYVMREP